MKSGYTVIFYPTAAELAANPVFPSGSFVVNPSTSGIMAVDPSGQATQVQTAGTQPLNNFTATVAPTTANGTSQGYSIGSRWIDTAADESYICTDATTGAALWSRTTVGTIAEVAGLQAALDLKATLASPVFTGNPQGPNPPANDNDASLATTQFVTGGLNLKANIASPALTGTPTAPTAVAGTNTTQLATTAFAKAAADARVGSVTGTAPIVSSGGVTPAISIPAATASVPGHMTAAAMSKLDSIAAGAEVNVQSDYAQVTTSADDFIKNKPDLTLKEDKSNKVTALSSASTDVQYPSAKVAFDQFALKQAVATLDRESLKVAYKYSDLWRPNVTDTPGMQLWYRADDIADSGVVSSWTDQSGNGRNATQTVVGTQPVVAVTRLNGWPTIEFGSDTDDSLSTVALPAPHGTEATLFAVFKNDTASADAIFSQQENTNSRRFHVHPRWTDNNLYVDLGNSGGSRITIAASPFVGTAFHIMTARRSGTTQGEVWHDGTSIGTDTTLDTPAAFVANAPFRIGTDAGGATDNFEGEIAEIIAFNTALSGPMRQRVEGYLAWKYGLQADLAATHPYKSAPPYAALFVADTAEQFAGWFLGEKPVYVRRVAGTSPATFTNTPLFTPSTGSASRLVDIRGFIDRGGQWQPIQAIRPGTTIGHESVIYQVSTTGSIDFYHEVTTYASRTYEAAIFYTK